MSETLLTSHTVPIIDIGPLIGNGENKSHSVTNAIAEACKSIGFFYIVNHGVRDVLCEQAFEMSKALFALPVHEKARIEIGGSAHMRGYFSYGADKSDGIHGDMKEGFDMASDLPSTDPYVVAGLPFYGPNVWPPTLPGFRLVMTEYHQQLLQLGRTLLKSFASGLGEKSDFFDDKFLKPMAQIRMLRYPPHVGVRGKHIGAGEHTDFGWITMIAQDQTNGLEVLDREGNWMDVPYVPSSFVVNVGDLMQRWTNDQYPATVHRVVNRSNRDRYSIAFFMDPDYFVKVECLTSLEANGQTHAKYPPILVGDYMNRRFYETTTFRDHKR